MSETSAPTEQSPDHPNSWTGRAFYLAIAGIACAQGVVSLDNVGVTILVRTIEVDLDTTLTAVQYGVAGQLLFGAAFMMVAARLGDLLGRTRMFKVGLALRLVGMVVTVVAPNAFVFFLGRAAISGIGTALALVNGLAILGVTFSGANRVKASAALTAGTAATGIVGPLLAGAFAGSIGWRWFYVLCAVLTGTGLIVSRWTPVAPAVDRSQRIDLLGALLAIISFGCVLFGIQQSTPWGLFEVRDAPFTIAGQSPAPFLLILGALLVVGFGWFEHVRRVRGHAVLFDVRILRNHFVRNANLAVMTFGAVLFGVTFLVPVYLQVIQGLSPFESSLRTVAYGIGALVLAFGVTRLTRRFELRGLFSICIGFLALAIFVLGWEIGPLPWGATPLGMFILGCGLSLTKGPLNVATQAAVQPEGRGQVSAVNETSWAIGGSLGVAIIGTILLASLAAGAQGLVNSNTTASPQAREIAQGYIDRGLEFVPEKRVRELLDAQGLEQSDVDILTASYKRSANDALLYALGGAMAITLLGLVFTRRLPRWNPSANPVNTRGDPGA